MSATLITRWYIEQPDKRIELEVNYVPNLGFVVEGHIHIYHTNEDGTRGALRARIPFDGRNPNAGADGSRQGTVGRYSSGSSGGSPSSDTDGASSEIARVIRSGTEVARATGSGLRVRSVPRASWDTPNRS